MTPHDWQKGRAEKVVNLKIVDRTPLRASVIEYMYTFFTLNPQKAVKPSLCYEFARPRRVRIRVARSSRRSVQAASLASLAVKVGKDGASAPVAPPSDTS
jgi:hypothetical protein